jgi:hypothetical protein
MGRLPDPRNLEGMSLRWRVGLVAIIAAAVVGGFMPHGAPSAADNSAIKVMRVVEAPLSAPLNCADAICGKGSPAPAAPAFGVAPAVALAGLVAAAAVVIGVRRRRGQQVPLPAGVRDPMFHPPRFS